MKDYVEILFESNEDCQFVSKSIANSSSLDKLLKKSDFSQISKQQLKENISAILKDVEEIFALEEKNTTYYIDEIEFGISIGVEGKVSLLSTVGGGVKSDATMIIKMKKKDS